MPLQILSLLIRAMISIHLPLSLFDTISANDTIVKFLNFLKILQLL